MLSHENNERLVRVGPGTPMGEMMRRYWHPVATSAQLPEPDGNPLRVSLLGERFVLFRDSTGVVGMLEELCMHRGASLAIGRVEDGGIRCLYHGWKFAADGTILDMPNHADCRLRERLKAAAFPVVERSGLIWSYIGPKGQQPPFRTFAADQAAPENRLVVRINVKVNYLALWEGGLDSSHVSVLHTNQARPSWSVGRGADKVTDTFQPLDDMAPAFEVEDTPFGYHYAATRKVGPDRGGPDMRNVRIVPAILPYGRIIPGPNMNFLVWETPDSDVATSTYITVYSDAPIDKDHIYRILGLDDARYWTPEDPNFKGTWENGFFQDRAAMSSNWTGLRGIEIEDVVTGLSYGPIYDRSKEHLVTADLAVVRVRRRLLDGVKMVEEGQAPPGAFISDMTRVCAPDVDVPQSTDWREIAAFHRTLEAAE